MIPLKDDNPTNTYPFVTLGLITINTLAFIYELSLGQHLEHFLNRYGAIPVFVLNMSSPLEYPPPYVTIFTSMFLHGGFFHTAGNMLYLWIFGNNIEDTMGHFRFILFYFICDIVCRLLLEKINTASTIPMLGEAVDVS